MATWGPWKLNLLLEQLGPPINGAVKTICECAGFVLVLSQTGLVFITLPDV